MSLFLKTDPKEMLTSRLLACFVSPRSFMAELNDQAEAMVISGPPPESQATQKAAMSEIAAEIDRRIPRKL